MESRQRLRPWLENKINSGAVAGLEWVDEDKKIFRVRWKHGGKQDWSPEDSQIFMEWAKHTGRYREGIDDLDYAKWKTRLRCAFNKAPDIKERKDLTNLEDLLPYRVYEFLPKKDVHRLPGLADEENSRSDTDGHGDEEGGTKVPVIPEMVQKFTASCKGETSMSCSLPSDLKNIPSTDLVRNEDGTLVQEQHPQILTKSEEEMDVVDSFLRRNMTAESVIVDDQTYPTDIQTGTPAVPQMQEHQSSQIGQGHALEQATYSQASALLQQQSGLGLYEEIIKADPELQAQFQTPTLDVNLNSEIEMLSEELRDLPLSDTLALEGAQQQPDTYQFKGHELLVKVQYSGADVEEKWILNEKGCRLYYGSDSHNSIPGTSPHAEDDMRQVFGPQDADQIHLPPCNKLFASPIEEQQAGKLLEHMDRGVLLDCVDGDVFATRFCRSVVYYSTVYEKGDSIRLNRQERTKVFDYQNNFLPAYTEYASGKSNIPPSSEVRLGIGQTWPFNDPISSVLISVKIFSAKAVAQLTMLSSNVGTGVSDSLQISSSDSFDLKTYCPPTVASAN